MGKSTRLWAAAIVAASSTLAGAAPSKVAFPGDFEQGVRYGSVNAAEDLDRCFSCHTSQDKTDFVRSLDRSSERAVRQGAQDMKTTHAGTMSAVRAPAQRTVVTPVDAHHTATCDIGVRIQ